MTLENVFYTLGITFMLLGIAFMLGLIVFAFWLKKKIEVIQKSIQGKIDTITTIAERPGEIAMSMGATIVEKLMQKAKGFITK